MDRPSGIILAGGRSRRMGTDKALLDLGGRPVIAHVAGRLAEVCAEVLVVGADPARYAFLGLPVVPDAFPGLGPLGGIHAGLAAMSRPAGLFVASDMPFLRPSLLRHLAEAGRGAAGGVPADAVVPRLHGRPEPLCALYRRSLEPVAARLLASGGGAVAALFDAEGVRVAWVDEADLRRLDPELSSFWNLNTPEDYRRAVARWTRPPRDPP